jgi:hypothetical protein
MRRFLRLYGEHPLHLVGLLASFVVAGYAAWRLFGSRPAAVVLWFVGAAVLNDLVLAPLYALIDRSGRRRGSFPPWWNHVRFPAAISLLLLLVWFPQIARLSEVYPITTDLTSSVYLGRWLLVTGALFAVSALAFLVGRLRRRSDRSGRRHAVGRS